MEPPPLPPPPPRSYRRIILILKLLTIVFLLAALVVLTTDTETDELFNNTEFISIRIHFQDLYTYRYLLGVCVIGMAYTLLQIVFSFYNIRTGKRLSSPTFDFYGDKLLSYILATGAAAGFGATSDMQSVFHRVILGNFFKKGYAASALVFIGFVYAAFLSIFSSYALPAKVLSYTLATGAAAEFGATSDMRSAFQGVISHNFSNRGYAASSLRMSMRPRRDGEVNGRDGDPCGNF